MSIIKVKAKNACRWLMEKKATPRRVICHVITCNRISVSRLSCMARLVISRF
nr:MAG TPA: hypothetical protein [Caudoviricetes sp.]